MVNQSLLDKNREKSQIKIVGPHLVFKLSRLLGCFHFDDRGKSSMARIAYSIFILVIFAPMLTLESYKSYSHHMGNSVGVTTSTEHLIRGTISRIVQFGSINIFVINSVSLLIRRNVYPKIMRNVRSIELHRMNARFIVISLTAFAFCVYFELLHEDWVKTLTLCTVRIQHVLFIAQYVVLSNRWNCYLKLLTKSTTKFDERMLEAHSKVINAHKIINDTYGLPILLCVLVAFVISVKQLFVFYASIKSMQMEYASIFSIAFHTIIIYWIASVSSYSSFLADEFNRVLFETMYTDTKMLSQVTLRTYLIKKYSINFTACGFFTVGYPFMTSLIAAAVTYLVVLIQFTE